MVAEDLRRWLLDRGAEVVGPASQVGRARSLIATLSGAGKHQKPTVFVLARYWHLSLPKSPSELA
jgi:Cft2 family RNA processing exonuclease